MKIYFPDITFNSAPLVWDYDEKTNRAICTFLTTEKVENSHAVLRELNGKQYLGITLTAESAIIEDFASFVQTYQSKRLLSKSKSFGRELLLDAHREATRNTPFHNSDSKEPNRGGAISVRSINETHPVVPISPSAGASVVPKEKPPRSTSSKTLNSSKSQVSEKPSHSPYSMFGQSKNSYESILLEDLIVKREDPGLWGDTVGYKSYFMEKTEQDRSERAEIYLRNESSFYKNNQYLLNDNICPIKSEIIILIEQVLKEELDPAYQQWKKEQGDKLTPQILQELFKYFRGAVLNAMTNESFNKELTEYEVLSDEERHRKFRANMPRYHAANHEVRKDRARLMMLDWLVLFDESQPLELGSIDFLSAKAIKMLASFKECLTKDPKCVQRLTELFGCLEALLIKSGEVERDNKMLTDELHVQLADKRMNIGDYSSLCNTVRIFLTNANQSLGKKHTVPDALYQKIAQQIVWKVIKSLIADAEFNKVPHTAKIRSSDNDLYLNQDWTGEIDSHLWHMSLDKIAKDLDLSKKTSTSMDDIKDMPWGKIATYLEVSKKSSVSQKDIEDMHWDKIVKQIMESKKGAASMELIADKISQIIRMKGKICSSQKFAGAEETNSASLEERAGTPEDRQTLNM
ncbi:hypothetical protein [Legionella maioricensis]|uniref:Uncharacterized protein n=1 Tax=Legionella maioricensis TaxID=2896528 RepID=A0A9X2IAI8_9GAMM|nr:hypothetical protein [Legionella maioricensis]MCL9683660.1 hypothetical protein [Legionella maioricensis]MCL9687682.1 hypothetical protein [Legionella maioricensis]